MKTLSFPEINDLENGQQIPSLTGKVKKVMGQLTGEGQYGTWWLQSFILADDHANEITCTWTGEDTVNELEGKNILIESTFNKKEQLVGIKREIKHKNGKKYECVKLDDRCKIKTLNGLDGGGERQSVAPSEAETKPGISGHSRDDPPLSNSNGISEARKHLMQSVNLYNLCVDAVDKCVKPHINNMDGELYQAAIGTLFIEASHKRTNDGINWWSYVDRMPTTPLSKPKIEKELPF
jgi:hypothetical protein